MMRDRDGERKEPHADDPPSRVLSARLPAIDALRGIVMVLMALDHTREYFQDVRIDATNVATTTVPLFFTRWITHYCAPLFVFLAGASAYLMRARGQERSNRDLARFLISRGLFLMVLEITVVRLVWYFTWSLDGMFLQVIWAIGFSMAVLGVLVFCGLPPRVIGIIGAAIVLGHNLLDPPPGTPGPAFNGGPPPPAHPLFTLLLRPGRLPIAPGVTWFEGYPMLPWFGIMALGFAFGEVLTRPRPRRIRITALMGLVATLAFIGLRWLAVYGNPVPFQVQPTAVKTLLAFLNCQKYPPSLLYALMTLGPGLLVLAFLDVVLTRPEEAGGVSAGAAETSARWPWRVLITLGRVPLFFYVLQWPVIRILAIIMGQLAGTPVAWSGSPFDAPPGDGFSLPFVYLMWLVVLVILYFPCRWYAQLKRRRRDLTWLSYL